MLSFTGDEFVSHSEAEREAFRSGALSSDWYQRFPMLFDKQDFDLTRNQPDYHFKEWLGATYLYRAFGYFSLVEKYQFENHPNKRRVLRELVEPEVFDLIVDSNFATEGMCPDLLVYRPDLSDYCFVEMKGRSESQTKNQPAHFDRLAQVSRRRIHILRTRCLSGAALEMDSARPDGQGR